MEVYDEWSKWGGGVLKQIFVHQCCSTVTGSEKRGGQAPPAARHALSDARQSQRDNP